MIAAPHRAAPPAASGAWQPRPGETVLFHERRAPPLTPLLGGMAAMLLIAAAGVADAIATPALALAAVGLLALLLRARPRVWIADQVVTDQRVVVAPRELPARWLERDELASVELVGTRAIFTARDGEELRFGHVSRPGRLFKRVRAGLPEVDADRRPDPGLPDLRHPLVAAPCARPEP